MSAWLVNSALKACRLKASQSAAINAKKNKLKQFNSDDRCITSIRSLRFAEGLRGPQSQPMEQSLDN